MKKVKIEDIHPDPSNPRQSDDARLHMLRLSLQKMGFVQPIYCDMDGMILSGHQRHRVASDLGFEHIPVEYVDLKEHQTKGINVLFNRATNDMTAFDTGSSGVDQIDIGELMAQAEAMPDYEGEFLAYTCKEESIVGIGSSVTDEYNRKSMLVTASLRRYGIRIPIVMTESGEIVNGVHRLFEARHEGIETWPIVRVPDHHGELAKNLLNYLSMDYSVDGEFARMLRYSAYRRPQNARGLLPKGMRFWAAGEKTIPDGEAYSTQFWENFRLLHGRTLLDFGSGLSKVSPVLNAKGFDCVDFEPYRIRPVPDDQLRSSSDGRSELDGWRDVSSSEGGVGKSVERESISVRKRGRRKRRRRGGDLPTGHASRGGRPTSDDGFRGKPDSVYSRECARGFLDAIRDRRRFDSIFLSSVLNSIPFPRDRQCVLAITHALCGFETIVYGTCRDRSDFLYEYSGVRNASYFVFDSEPGVRLGDALSNPKIQKFHTQEEFREIAGRFWNTIDTWPGGNIFYWRAQAPKRVNFKTLRAAIEFEFDLPYADGTTMDLVEEAIDAFSVRYGVRV